MSEFVLKPDCPRVWAIHYSKRKKQNYFYNRITGESFWERPPGITDSDILTVEDFVNINNRDYERNQPELKQRDILNAVKAKLRKELVVKNKPEQDSGVVDLYDATDNEVTFSNENVKSEDSQCVVYGPGPSDNDLKVNFMVSEIRRTKNKAIRHKLMQKEHETRYKQFMNQISGGSRKDFKRKIPRNLKLEWQRDLDTSLSLHQAPKILEKTVDERKFNFRKRKSKKKLVEKCDDVLPPNFWRKSNVPEAQRLNSTDCDSNIINSFKSPPLSPLVDYSSDSHSNDDLIQNSPSLSSLTPSKENRVMEVEQPSDLFSNHPISPSFSTEPGKRFTGSVQNFEYEYEEMDWEVAVPETEILKDIGEVRKELETCFNGNQNDVVFMEICEDRPVPAISADLFVVVDTNVLISNLNVVKKMTDITPPEGRGIVVVVPWQVMQELDKLKMRSRIGQLSSKAIDYVCRSLLLKNPCVIGQSPRQHFLKTDSIKHFEVADDAILNCCLQLIDQNKNVVLCTNDKNLLVKACASGLRAVTASMFVKEYNMDLDAKSDFVVPKMLRSSGTSTNNSCTIKAKTTNVNNRENKDQVVGNISFKNCSKSVLLNRELNMNGDKSNFLKRSMVHETSLNKQMRLSGEDRLPNGAPVDENNTSSRTNVKPLNPASLPRCEASFTSLASESNSHDLMGMFQEHTNKLLVHVFVKGMKDFYGDDYMKKIPKLPPWTTADLYRFLRSHWQKIVGYDISNRVKKILQKLELRLGRKDEVSYTIKELIAFIDSSLNFSWELNRKYPTAVTEYTAALKNLRLLCENEESQSTSEGQTSHKKERDAVLNSDVTLPMINRARESIEFFCTNLSNTLGLKGVCQKSNLSGVEEQTCSLDILAEKLPSVNSFLNEFVLNSERILVQKPARLTLRNTEVKNLFSTLSGFLDVSDPDFSAEHLLNFIKNNWEKFKGIVSDLDKLKYSLAKFTIIVKEKTSVKYLSSN